MNIAQHTGPGRRQSGAALLIALVIIALASFIALQMTQRLELDIARTSTLNRNFAAAEYARGLEALARAQLRDDFINEPEVDRLSDPWATPLPPLPVPGGAVTGQLFDLSGRFNLNWLVQNGTADEARVDQLRRLLLALELDPGLADVITDWIDSDNTPRSNGAETAVYAERRPPYRPSNRAMNHVSELRLLARMDADSYARLAPHVSALPANANGRRLNVNTASVEVIMSLDSALSRDRALQLVGNGQANFGGIQQFIDHPAMTGIVIPNANNQLSVRSSHFLALAQVELDEVPRRYYIVLERDGSSLSVLQRSYGTP